MAQARMQLEKAARQVLQVKLDFQKNSDRVSKNDKSHLIVLRLPAILAGNKPTLYFGVNRTAPLDNATRSRLLDTNVQEFTQAVNADKIDDQLILSFRGHQRIGELSFDNKLPVTMTKVDFQRDVIHDPTLKVIYKTSEKTRVVVMLDCSNSMKELTLDGKVTAFTEAKRITEQIITAFQNVDAWHNLEISLVLFGARVNDEHLLPGQFLNVMERVNNQILRSGMNKIDADGEYTKRLLTAVRRLEPAQGADKGTVVLGCTPYTTQSTALSLNMVKIQSCTLLAMATTFLKR